MTGRSLVNRTPLNPRRALRHGLAALLATLICAAAGAQTAAVPASAAPASAASAPGPTVRPELAKPLQAAQELTRVGTPASAKEALARLAEAEAVGHLTPYETYLTQRLKAVAAFGAGDVPLSIDNFERVLGSSQLPPAERLPIIETTAKLSIQSKDYVRAATWLRAYKAAGGTDPALLRLLPQVLAETGDHAGAVAAIGPMVQADIAAQRATPESLLRTLAFSQDKLGDAPGYLATLEQLAQHYPKSDYWNELIARTLRRDGFAGERLRLDSYRLMQAIGTSLTAEQTAEMAERALQAGLPAEAQKLMDDGYASGLFGKGGAAAAHQKLRQQATKAAAQDKATLGDSEASARNAKEGNALVNLGFALSAAGDHERALALMAQGQAKGGLRRSDDVLLHLGIAQVRAGRNDDALRSFAAVKGGDGNADLARLWSLWLRRATTK